MFWKDLLAGYISGIANICAGQPFDITKVRIQSQGVKDNFVKVMMNIAKNEGLFALWKGSLFPLICFGACNSICFAVNESSKHFLRNRHKNSTKLTFVDYYLAGGLAGMA